MNREHIVEINITRALAIVGVLIVHATSFPVSQLSTSSSLYSLYSAFNTFFRFGTPTFIFLSSFVLFYSYYYRPLDKQLIARFYKKRLLYILLPYVIFSIIYYMFNFPYYSSVMTNKEMLLDFLKKLAMGKTYSHLYFIFISLQFYILFPLFLFFFKKFQNLVKYTILIGFIVQWAFVLLNHYYLHFSNKGSISLSYFSYYFLGIFVGVYYDKIASFFKVKGSELLKTKKGHLTILIWCGWLIASLSHIVLWNWTRTTGGGSINALVYELLWNIHTFFSAIILTQASYVIYRKFSAKIVNPLIHLGVVSFGIYLIHLLVLNIYQITVPYNGSSMLYHFKTVGGFFVTLFVSWLIVSLIKKYIPLSWVLFGSSPKVIPYKKEQQRDHLPSKKSDSASF